MPEPTGVVAIMAPQESSLLGLVSALAPVLCTGNTAVVVTSQHRPLPAVSLSEVLATSDLPGGVANVLTGFTAELGPWLASHRDVNAIDLTGVAPEERVALQRAAADNVKRVYAPDDCDFESDPGTAAPDRLRRDEDGLAPDRGLSRLQPPLWPCAAAVSCAAVALPTTCHGRLPSRWGSVDGVSACVHHFALKTSPLCSTTLPWR